jgi:hypothetical protein
VRTRRFLLLCGLVAAACVLPASAQADFGLVPGTTSATAINKDGSTATQASSHPYAFSLHFQVNTDEKGLGEGGAIRDVIVDLPPGLIGNPSSVPQCPQQLFEGGEPHCPLTTQVGVLEARIPAVGDTLGSVYNLTPPPGVAARLGYKEGGLIALQQIGLRTDEGYGLGAIAPDVPTETTAITETIWGLPADPGHDAQRGDDAINGGPPKTSDAPKLAYLTMPASCQVPLVTIEIDSALNRGHFVGESAPFTNTAGQPQAMTGCTSVPFSPKFSSQPTSRSGTSPSGLDFELKLPDQGLTEPGSVAETEPKKTVVTLPEGMTINAGFAEGASVCTQAQYEAEQIDTPAGAGCPEASKLGSVIAQSPLLEEPVEGAVYLAAPYENQSGTLGALYLVARAQKRGVLIKQPGQVDFDNQTGQIEATFDALPPVPYSSFALHFREGARAPLATPKACGSYKTVGRFTPFSAEGDSEAVETTASFTIRNGPDGGACPSGGLQPFHPGLIAGSINNAAGSYSPFNIGLSRTDSEQEITHFSIKLPPGVTGKLAGVPFCPDIAIAAAKGRERTQHGGQEEIGHPSCPQASEIGHTLVGAGVGFSLTYVPGKLYMAGPYKGSKLSIVAITAAKAGPFDLGTVVIREALKVDPVTAEVSVDAGGSDPIPHIVNGIPVSLRDIRVYVDRPEFVLNPTNCEPTSTASTVLGSGTNFASEADDRPVTVTTRFQAADCASLGFRPGVKVSLSGPTRRAGLPKLKAVVATRPGDANIGRAVVTLPKSEFLEQGHIGTICTRVQFNAGGGNGEQCPAKSIYGHAVAVTPLLSEPLEGAVYLRSNGGERQLPDLVAALHTANIDIDLLGFIDSLHPKGSDVSQIRTTFAAVPDAPVTRFTLEMFGGKKGLIVNSTNLCKGTHRAIAEFTGQNGMHSNSEPAVQAQCGKKKGKKAKKGHGDAKGKGHKASKGNAQARVARSIHRPFAR